jgi:hypothetical protein
LENIYKENLDAGGMEAINKGPAFGDGLFVCLFVSSRTSSFSAFWYLSPLPVTGLQI